MRPLGTGGIRRGCKGIVSALMRDYIEKYPYEEPYKLTELKASGLKVQGIEFRDPELGLGLGFWDRAFISLIPKLQP